MPRVLNIHTHGRPTTAVYIGRGSLWGNPFHIGTHGSREEVVQLYEDYLFNSPHLLARLGELTGKDLLCYCAPRACHGDVLLRWANTPQFVAQFNPLIS